jgi:hypothetical protein
MNVVSKGDRGGDELRFVEFLVQKAFPTAVPLGLVKRTSRFPTHWKALPQAHPFGSSGKVAVPRILFGHTQEFAYILLTSPEARAYTRVASPKEPGIGTKANPPRLPGAGVCTRT